MRHSIIAVLMLLCCTSVTFDTAAQKPRHKRSHSKSHKPAPARPLAQTPDPQAPPKADPVIPQESSLTLPLEKRKKVVIVPAPPPPPGREGVPQRP